MKKYKTHHIVTCFLEFKGKILLLKRSENTGTYKGKWAGVSGYVESTPKKQALKEIKEETGLNEKDLELVKIGNVASIIDTKIDTKWCIHPFLFKIKTPEKIKLDWEHDEMKWIKQDEINKYQTVPKLKEVLKKLISPTEFPIS